MLQVEVSMFAKLIAMESIGIIFNPSPQQWMIAKVHVQTSLFNIMLGINVSHSVLQALNSWVEMNVFPVANISKIIQIKPYQIMFV